MADANSFEIWSLAAVACATGVIHTLLGPDHYIPFVAMSKAGGWSLRKTLCVTWVCGLGHVASSVLLGFIGIGLGLAVGQLEFFEETRGGIAGWLLIGFGLAYFAWGLNLAIRRKSHSHVHVHANGNLHAHPHAHVDEHTHVHAVEKGAKAAKMSPWILFTIFFFGPCEPLIPLLMYPAAESNTAGVVLVAGLFAAATLLTMTLVVVALISGVSFIRFPAIERYSHALAGFVVLTCGVAIKLGL